MNVKIYQMVSFFEASKYTSHHLDFFSFFLFIGEFITRALADVVYTEV